MIFLLTLNLPGPTFLLIVAVLIALPIWALIDLLRSKYSGKNTKLLWVLLIFLVPIFGSLLYLVRGRQDKNTQH